MKRAYRCVDPSAGPRARYDAVIVGAGIGGMVCANLLARAGLSVLLCEQHYVVGGYCSTFRRRGYTFDAATHFYPLLGNPDTITGRLLADLGIEVGWVKMDPVDRFHLPDGSVFAVPADLAAYLDQLRRWFPAEAGAIDAFFKQAREASLLGLLAYFRDRDVPRLRPLVHLTLRDVLDRTFRDPRLKLILTADCPHWGSTPAKTSYLFDSTLRLSYFRGNYYPSGGSQAFSDALARGFADRGGDILLNARARRIVVHGGRARGVEIEFGPVRHRRRARVAAGVVISNGDMTQTLEQLVGPGHLPPVDREAVRRLRPSMPCFLTHIGLRGVSEDDLRRVHGYHWHAWDPDAEGFASLTFKLFVPTLYEPAMAPPGCHVLIVQKVIGVDFNAVDDWPAHKAAIERGVLVELARLLPGFRDRAEVLLSASAATSWRYTLNRGGAMLGWEMAPDQLGAARPGIEGPLPGLYFVGHWTRPGGGITPVIISAVRAAEALLGAPAVPRDAGGRSDFSGRLADLEVYHAAAR